MALILCVIVCLIRKPDKKKVKKKPKNAKPPAKRKPSQRWKNLRLVVGDDRYEKSFNFFYESNDEQLSPCIMTHCLMYQRCTVF